MPHIQFLAQELIDRIIDEFGSQFPLEPESRRTLISCTAVCRGFRSRSQQILWTDIRITNGTAVPNLLSRLASTPSIFYHLRAFRMGFEKETRNINGMQELLNLITVHKVDLQHLGVCYDNEDAFHSLKFPDDSPLLKSLSYFGASSTLTTLHLKYLSVPMIHLCKFVNLKTLIIERCDFYYAEGAPAPAPNGSHGPQTILLPSLEVLHIIRCLKDFTEMFLHDESVQCGNLRTLRCVSKDITDPLPVVRFLHNAGVYRTLENLELIEVTRLWEFRKSFSESLGLNRLPNLRHVKLKTIMANPYGRLNFCPTSSFLLSQPNPPWAMVQTPTILETVEVVIDTPFWDGAPDSQLLDFLQNDRHWKSLDADLANLNVYPSLRAVNFLICLRPPSQSDKVLTLHGAEQHLRHALRFPILDNSPSIALKVDITLSGPLD